MSSSNCQFEEDDRVDHKLFGLGTVDAAPVAVVGPDVGRVGGVRDAGWRILVRWDDPSRTAGAVMHHMLHKVSSRTFVPSPTGIDGGNLCFRLGWWLDEKWKQPLRASGLCPNWLI